MITEEQILHALSHVDDPDLNKDLVTLNMIENINIESDRVSFDVVLTTPACPMKDMIQNACINAVKHFVDKDLQVAPNMTSKVTSGRDKSELLPGVRNIIAVASGKGGVGKSTVAVNLALSLARSGASVGILDADIYGPSIPTMFGLNGQHPKMVDDKIQPLEKNGIKVLSIGFLVDDKQAIIWRGPMASSAITQLISDVNWGSLDYLLIDLPPGTGDIHLTIAQSVPLTGSVVVTTPQEVALADCRKAIGMFNNAHIKIPVLGIVENMSYFTPPELPDNKYYLFGKNGGVNLAAEFKFPLLGQLPLVENIRERGDAGNLDTDLPPILKKPYDHVASEMARQIAILNQNTIQTNEVSSNS